MSKMNDVVLLVDFQTDDAEYAVPLGCASIAGALVDTGLVARKNLRILVPHVEENLNALSRRYLALEPTIIGFSLYCWNSKAASEMARILKRERPSLVLIAGGPDAEFFADRDSPSGLPFDAVFLGPAETSVQTWMQNRNTAAKGGNASSGPIGPIGPIGPVSGNALNSNLTPQATQFIRSEPVNLSKLSSPWLSGLLDVPRNHEVLWELTRGCPYRCSYCYEGRGLTTVQHVPQKRLEDELAFFVNEGVEKVFVLDPTFNLQKDRALSLLSLLKEKGDNILWNFEVRAELLDAKQAQAFGDLNCSVQIGLQSIQPKVMEAIGRDFDRKVFVKKIDLLNTNGVVFGFDLIYGLPGDSLRGFRESLDFALSLYPNHLDIFPLAVLPGTRLREQAAEFHLEYEPESPYRLKSQPSFPAKDLARAAKIAHACDIFYTLGRAVPWFNAVLQPLDLRASGFFQDIANAVEARFPSSGRPEDILHKDIEAFQCEILTELYKAHQRPELLPAVLDLVRYNGALSRAFAENQTTELRLNYPLSALDSGEILDIEGYVEEHRTKPGMVQIMPGVDGPVVKMIRRE